MGIVNSVVKVVVVVGAFNFLFIVVIFVVVVELFAWMTSSTATPACLAMNPMMEKITNPAQKQPSNKYIRGITADFLKSVRSANCVQYIFTVS